MFNGYNEYWMCKCKGIVFLIFLFAFCFACGVSSRSDESKSSQRSNSKFLNPVFAHDFADPTVIKASDGFYYAYGTNTVAKDGKMINIQVARSNDLVNWTLLGDAMPQKPSWADKDFWAPHVIYDRNLNRYFLYYSGESSSDSLGKCLGVASSPNPAGPFIDKGTALLCGDSFINIDPMAFDDPVTGKKLLYWGSAFQPIKVQELSNDRVSFKEGSSPLNLLNAVPRSSPDNYQRLIEGAWIQYENGFYYMYYSGDNCCGDKAHYAVMVARSQSATGPFEPKPGNNPVILEKNSRWIAPGHNSVVQDASGANWMVYHAIDSADRNGGRIVLIDQIIFQNGWPTVGGGSPSIDSVTAPIIALDRALSN